tara:strand:+ start:66 stop:266 length:201 start_codon:yes stop_codon:yes gene_type:complete
MNLKERGLTLGDLLLIVIVVLSISFIVKKINKEKQLSINIYSELTGILNNDYEENINSPLFKYQLL